MDKFIRSEAVLGEGTAEILRQKKVAVFGLGGVGSFCAEALVRGGIGRFIFVDGDVISESNINRQLLATERTVGQKKTFLMRERALAINSLAEIEALDVFYSEQTADSVDLHGADYIVDAIDTVSSKLFLAERAKELGVPLISCMGTGNKLNPAAFRVADIYDTRVCPLAKVMRRELKKRGIERLKTVYSEEEPIGAVACDSAPGRHSPGSVSFVPPVAGFIMAGEVIGDLLKFSVKEK